ncbi:hypothetical protein AZI87_14395 [Bdellovibrio bacteriovorus]|uniref:Uncharacterized protein n=1 Tax=Bdellovibrio bacteriovorus TaxID=959 RepID=A0A161PPF5_BDEBC|nr:hypothetical protein [Bdellovibrio bacteriovorus]KYG63588.1 hypothetical protein AZI87_14395 [Bdellovibrio bacteriovorus]
MSKCLLALLSLMTAYSIQAQAQAPSRTSKLKPLYFQADKNNLQVLPQRFEYTLIDEDRLKIGDILIDTTQITFQIEPSTQKGLYRIRFTWPAGLVNEGELSVKNNSGKAIFTTVLSKENVTITDGVPATGEDEHLRSQVATFSADEVEASLVDDMKYFPFMSFCIYRESEETRIYMCSKELYLSSQQGQMVVKTRSSTKKAAQVEINGKIVGNQGIIYLNDRSENVAFKAQTQTGAFFEIETRKKDVDFKDAVVSDDGSRIILTASGAEPVDEKKVKKLSETDWQISLSKNRPVLYLKGDGDIPMRQEFYVRGELPKAKNRPYLSQKSVSRTYASKLSFTGISPEGVQVRSPENDGTSQLEPLKKNQFQWKVSGIPAGVETRRYLNVQADGQNFVAGYDVFRGQPFGLGVGASYQTPSGIAFGALEFQWWFENFLMINADWSRFKWGLSVERLQHFTEKDDVAKVDFTTLELKWRAHEGFNLIDATWGLTLPLQMVQGENASATAYGLGAFWLKKPNRWMKPFMHWTEYKLQYFAGSSGSDFKVSSAYNLKALAYWQFNADWYLRYGLGLSDYKYDPAAAKEEMQIDLNAGIFWKF